MLELMHPDERFDESREEGTASHELAAQMILAHSRAGAGWPSDAVGKMASNGVVWDESSFEAAELYADDVHSIMRETAVFGGDNLKIEQIVEMPRIHPESWGTPDSTLFDQKSMTLYGWDYKYGHKIVEAYQNWQMIEYIIGRLDEITAGNGLADQTITVVITVVQPRARHRDGPIRRWTINSADLRAYANFLHAVEHEALGPDPTCATGPECIDCKARLHCETLTKAYSSALQFAGRPIEHNPTVEQQAIEYAMTLQAEELIKARKKGLEASLETVIETGGSVPGWALEAGYGQQKWSGTDDEIIQLGEMMNVDLRKDGVKTPKQAIKAGMPESIVKDYRIQPRTAPKLVPVSGTRAGHVFGKPFITTEE